MNSKLVLVLLLLIFPFLGYSQLKSGLTLNFGYDNITNYKPNPNTEFGKIVTDEDGKLTVTDKTSFSLGYKFRLQQKEKPYFYDFDVNLGVKNWSSKIAETYIWPDAFGELKAYDQDRYESSNNYCYLSLGASFNYKIWKGLYAGLGLEPTWYFYQSGEKSAIDPAIDLPLKGSIGYDFKFIGLAVSYRQGIFNVIDVTSIQKGKISDWQVSLYIPF